MTSWGSLGATRPSIRLEYIGHFDARGKHHVYSRGDNYHYARLTMNMDVWRSKDGRLFARFWSRNEDVDWESYAIVGLSFPRRSPEPMRDDEDWIPKCLRDEYDDWVWRYLPEDEDGPCPPEVKKALGFDPDEMDWDQDAGLSDDDFMDDDFMPVIRLIVWEHRAAARPAIRLEHIENFNARGKQCVYGRSDRLDRLTLNMDVWHTKPPRYSVWVA